MKQTSDAVVILPASYVNSAGVANGSISLPSTSAYTIAMPTPAAPSLATNQSGTDLAAGDYKITVVGVDPAGGVTLYPSAVTQTVGAGGHGRIIVTYVAPAGASTVRVYTSTMGGATPDRYFVSSSATTYNLDTLTGATVAALPVTATALRVSVGYSASNINWLGQPLQTPAESWVGPSSTTGVYFKGGNVGIGTTGPVNLLDVAGSISIGTGSSGVTRWVGYNRNDGLFGSGTSGGMALVSYLEGGVAGHYSVGIDFGVNQYGVGNFTPLSLRSGNVGIGTTGPAAKLDIADTTLAGSGSLAGSALNIAQTANTSGSPTMIKGNLTNTASGASTLLLDLQVGAASTFKVNPVGLTTIGSIATQDVLVLQPNTSATRFTGTITPADLTANQTWTLPNQTGTLLLAMYGGMFQYGNATAIAIGTNAEYYALDLMGTGLVNGFTYIAGTGGGAGAAITAVADATGGDITVSATGTWVTSQPVTIHGTTNYDGAYVVKTGGTGSFKITKAYVSSQTGIARGAAALKANAGSAGTYHLQFTASAFSAANSKTWHIEANRNATALDNVASKAQSSANSTYRALAGNGFSVVADGDVFWLTVYNDTDATNITCEYVNYTMQRVGS